MEKRRLILLQFMSDFGTGCRALTYRITRCTNKTFQFEITYFTCFLWIPNVIL